MIWIVPICIIAVQCAAFSRARAAHVMPVALAWGRALMYPYSHSRRALRTERFPEAANP